MCSTRWRHSEPERASRCLMKLRKLGTLLLVYWSETWATRRPTTRIPSLVEPTSGSGRNITNLCQSKDSLLSQKAESILRAKYMSERRSQVSRIKSRHQHWASFSGTKSSLHYTISNEYCELNTAQISGICFAKEKRDQMLLPLF